MHHVVLERWSRGSSALHASDPRAKILAALCFLVMVATTPIGTTTPAAAGYGLLLAAAILAARLPLGSVLLRACVVLPFAAAFALMSLLAGEAPRAAALVQKSYLSAVVALLVVGTTPFPTLMRGFESLGVPRFLILVVQFLYRYLFVISEQAQHMRHAALSRGLSTRWSWRRRRELPRAAAGALAVLFARSYSRAEGIHRAMLARGFRGHFSPLAGLRFHWKDASLLAAGILAPVVVRITLGAE